MAERTNDPPGTFSWIDLTSPDQEAAKRFYGELLGWSFQDLPVGDGAYYTMAMIDGAQRRRDRAAARPAARRRRPAAVELVHHRGRAPTPPWSGRTSLGGSAHAPAFDVMDAGRMAVLQDPQGAYFMVWEPRQQPRRRARQRAGRADLERAHHAGPGRVRGLLRRPVRLDHRDRAGPDGVPRDQQRRRAPERRDAPADAARRRRRSGWSTSAPPTSSPTAAKVTELGGTVLAPPMAIEGMGEIAVAADPLGDGVRAVCRQLRRLRPGARGWAHATY